MIFSLVFTSSGLGSFLLTCYTISYYLTHASFLFNLDVLFRCLPATKARTLTLLSLEFLVVTRKSGKIGSSSIVLDSILCGAHMGFDEGGDEYREMAESETNGQSIRREEQSGGARNVAVGAG